MSEACDNCYAETWAKRLGKKVWGPSTPRRFFGDTHWNEPLKWNKEAGEEGIRRRVFCASMADVFENRPDLVEHRLRLLKLIEQTPNLDWLLLTKRIHLVRKQLPKGYAFPKNVWLGATVETQDAANKRIEYLLEFDSPSVRFLSCEPMLGPIDLSQFLKRKPGSAKLDWVIAGGESGHGSRPMNPAWPQALLKQCSEAGVAFHFKQWGEYAPIEQVSDMLKKSTPIIVFDRGGNEIEMARIGKGKAGRTLSERHWDQFPTA